MKLNTLIKTNYPKLRVGRGIVLKRKTSGRGVKGQKSRSGVAIKSFEEDKCLFTEDFKKEDLKNRKKILQYLIYLIWLFLKIKKLRSMKLVSKIYLKKN